MYTLTELGDIGLVTGINASGQLCGLLSAEGLAYRCIVENAVPVLTRLPRLRLKITTAFSDEPTYATASVNWPVAINADGDIVGRAMLDGSTHDTILQAFLYSHQDDAPINLHEILITQLNYLWSRATALTNRFAGSGLAVVGTGDRGPWRIDFPYAHPHAGEPKATLLAEHFQLNPLDLAPLASGLYPDLGTSDVLINNSGVVAMPTHDAWYLCAAGKATKQVVGVGSATQAPYLLSINDAGDVLLANPEGRLLFFGGGTSHELGAFSPTTGCSCLNRAGQVVFGDRLSERAFLWEKGRLKDLNGELPSSSSTGPQLTDATGINDSGRIVCSGPPPSGNSPQSLLLTPRIGPVPHHFP